MQDPASELLRIPLPCTRGNRATEKGGPRRNQQVTRERRRRCSEDNTLASADESAMNFLDSQHKKNVGKRRLRPQKLLRIYRLSVKMGACTRILVRWRERQTRREAGAQSLRASYI
jgi:hypothetical protein